MLRQAMSVPGTQRAGSALACMNGPEINRMQFRKRKKRLRMGHVPPLPLKALQGQAGRSLQSRQFQERMRCRRGGRGIGAEPAAKRDAGRGQEAEKDADLGRGARVVRVLQCLGRMRDVGLAPDPGPGQDLDLVIEEEEEGMILRRVAEVAETCLRLDLAVLMVAPCHLSSPEGLPRPPGGSWGVVIKDIR